MDTNGNLLKILLSDDLDNYDPQTLEQQLDNFEDAIVGGDTIADIDSFTTILDAFRVIVKNAKDTANGTNAFTGLKLSDGVDEILLKANGRLLQAEIGGAGGDLRDIITTDDLSPTAMRLLEINGETLDAGNLTASFPVSPSTGTAYTATLSNFQPNISFKLVTGVANQIEIISGGSSTTVNAGNTDVVIPNTNLQIDSFDGTVLVLEKTDTAGFNALETDLVMEYFGQL